MKYDDAEKIADGLGIDLTHECDERAHECTCESGEDAPEGHAPGDVRCVARTTHTACSHDVDRIASAQR